MSEEKSHPRYERVDWLGACLLILMMSYCGPYCATKGFVDAKRELQRLEEPDQPELTGETKEQSDER